MILLAELPLAVTQSVDTSPQVHGVVGDLGVLVPRSLHRDPPNSIANPYHVHSDCVTPMPILYFASVAKSDNPELRKSGLEEGHDRRDLCPRAARCPISA